MVAVFPGYLISFRKVLLCAGDIEDGLDWLALDHGPASHRILVEANAFADRYHGNIPVMGHDPQHIPVLYGDDGVI